MKYTTLLFIICVVLVACSRLLSQESSNPSITADEIRQHIRYLASPELKGRRAGEEGNVLAAKYIAQEFERYGLKTGGNNGSYFQEFQFISSVEPGEKNSFALQVSDSPINYVLNEQFRPIAFTSDTNVSAPLVFVGYGISAKKDSLQYDDYADVDVKGKIVVVLRYTPEGSKEGRYTSFSALSEKAYAARDHGAIGIILLTGPPGEDGADLISFKNPMTKSVGIPAVTLRWSDMDSVFRLTGKDLKSIRHEIDSTQKPASFAFSNVTVSLQTQTKRIYATSANIAGFLEGSDPTLKQQILVLGAHMDHLGMGGEGSLKPDTVAVHPGADDNASGTAALLELAQYFSAHQQTMKRSMLFLSFSGEEEGLLGSDYYVKHPLVLLDSCIAMINMDMIGRLDSTLVVEGMGTSPGWETIVRNQNPDNTFKLALKPDGYGPSDHSSFYSKNIPVMFFFTNLHKDYHRPTDTWDKINYSGEQQVAAFVAQIATTVANQQERPAFTKTAMPVTASGGDRQGLRVSLGLIPDYASEVTGLKISGVRSGSAAEKAGLQREDIIIKFDDADVNNIYDFMHVLGKYKPGDKVTIIVKRGSSELPLTATLEARK